MKPLVAIAAALVLTASTAASAAPAHHDRHGTRRIDACLRRHGWPYGYVGLLRAEIRHGHPNGLVRICGGRDVQRSAARPAGHADALLARHRGR
jgi:hypothetical protein